MNGIWDENRIREEIKQLDEKTGLSGAELQIVFNNSKRMLAFFSVSKELSFCFSEYWFHNPEWTTESAVDVIRHEYAHYMDWVVYKNVGHGKTWKHCCIQVGAIPTRLYNEDLDEYYKAKKEREDRHACEMKKYKEGDMIKHGRFGTGIIQSVEIKEKSFVAVVNFGGTGIKKMDLNWVEKHCTKLSA